MALGAFLGGLVLAESEFSHQAFADIRPLRDILSGLFFISLGMLVDVTLVFRMLPIVLAVTITIVLVKAVVATGALWVVATPLRVAVTAGIGPRRSASSPSSWVEPVWISACCHRTSGRSCLPPALRRWC